MPTKILLTATTLMILALAPFLAVAESTAPDSEFYELRIHTFESIEQHAIVEEYWEKAAIPALNRLGVGPIGVFKEMESEENKETPRIVVLIPYASMEQFVEVNAELEADEEYAKRAAPYYEVEKKAPAYKRIESNLLQALKVQPKLKAPDTSKDRIFELREYEGHSERANDFKMLMFNDGEADIFAETGLTSVFYSKTIIGKNRPSLIYMVTFDDMDAHAKAWKTFLASPKWEKIKKAPKYDGGGLSGLTSYMLRPTKFSQI